MYSFFTLSSLFALIRATIYIILLYHFYFFNTLHNIKILHFCYIYITTFCYNLYIKKYKRLIILLYLLYHLINLYFYFINIASPKLKKRYFSFTASLYAFIIKSFPASADTNRIKVDSGKWKFVIRHLCI